MRSQRVSFVDFLFLALVIAAIPVGAYHASIGLYTQAAMALGAAAVGFALALGWNPGAVAVPGIEPVSSLEGRLAVPAVATVTAIEGTCVLAYRPGNNWGIDDQRRLSRPICRAAATALVSALSGGPADPSKAGREVSCDCPLMRGQLTFAVQTA